MWKINNPSGQYRVIVTKCLPGQRWLDILVQSDCRIEVCESSKILGVKMIKKAIGNRCHGVIGQLTEDWNESLFITLKRAGGRILSNYAVGYNNVDLQAATKLNIAVGNTPGVLTETTAELAVALTLAASRRIVEADRFVHQGRFQGWIPTLLLGELLSGKTIGLIGVGRIGSSYARMMIYGFQMNCIYFDLKRNKSLEKEINLYNRFLQSCNRPKVRFTFVKSIEEVLKKSDVVSLHTVLNENTKHLINSERLRLMKSNGILINTSRGSVIDEKALVQHCQRNPEFRVGLDVFENEPKIAPGLRRLENVINVPHIGSATTWTREGMAIIASCNVRGILKGYPVWNRTDVIPFLGKVLPNAVPSIVNNRELKIPTLS